MTPPLPHALKANGSNPGVKEERQSAIALCAVPKAIASVLPEGRKNKRAALLPLPVIVLLSAARQRQPDNRRLVLKNKVSTLAYQVWC